jgi:hypothetical protein
MTYPAHPAVSGSAFPVTTGAGTIQVEFDELTGSNSAVLTGKV